MDTPALQSRQDYDEDERVVCMSQSFQSSCIMPWRGSRCHINKKDILGFTPRPHRINSR